MNGSCALIYKTLAGLVLILLSPPVSLAQTREVVFPAADSSLVGDAGSLVFSQDGKLGFALLVKNTLSSAQLFCFSVEQGSVIDSVDLAPDFGTAQIGQQPPIIFIKAVTRPSIILAYGRDTSGNQRVLALPYDASGHLSRNWAQSFPNGGVFPSGSDLATSADGSRVFVLYTDAGLPTALNRLALLDAGNGAVLATRDLSSPATDRSIVFDESHNRAIVLSDTSTFLLKPDSDLLEVDAIVQFSDAANRVHPFIVGLSAGGRFLLGYGGFQPTGRSAGVLGFVTYDLQARSATESDIPSKLFPLTNDFSFNRNSGMLAAPLKARFRQTSDGVILVPIHPRPDIGIYNVTADGSISQSIGVQTPPASPVGINGIVSLSSSGALGFVPTTDGNLLAFDTLTGEIVDDEAIGTNSFTSAQLLEAQGLLSFTNGTNRLSLIDISTGPVITSANVHMASTTLTGGKFLFGAHVQINSVDIGEVTRDPSDPGHRMILKRGKRDFPPGQPFTITVVNRDGAASNAFVLAR